MEAFSNGDGFQGAVDSRIGGRRENQDSYGFADTALGLLTVVCDGMGGGPGGSTASRLAVDAIVEVVKNAPEDSDPTAVLEGAAAAADNAVREASAADPDLRGMGTTCVALLIGRQKACVMHMGDSRCYQLRAGKQVFRTLDHSYVGEMVRRGSITEEQARNSGYSNVITRAIGVGDDRRCDVDIIKWRKGDRFALMTDGIWGAVAEPELVGMLGAGTIASGLVTDIASRIDQLGMDAGGHHDNLTLAIVDTTDADITEEDATVPITRIIPDTVTLLPEETQTEDGASRRGRSFFSRLFKK